MRIPLAADLKTRTARATPVGTAVTGVQMLNNGSGYQLPSSYNIVVAAATLSNLLPGGNTYGDRNALVWNGTKFCLVGSTAAGNVNCTSPDGITWTPHATMPAAPSWDSVAWNGAVFCAVGESGAGTDTNYVATSPDGITWTSRAMPVAAAWRNILFFNNLFVAFGYSYGTVAAVIATSPDGITWTSRAVPATTGAIQVTLVANATRMVALFAAGVTAGVSWVSTDGITWGTAAIAVAGTVAAATWNGATFCAVMYNSAVIALSADGLTWTAGTIPEALPWVGISSLGSVMMAVAYSAVNRDYTSTDNGITWRLTVAFGPESGWTTVSNNGSYFAGVSGGVYPYAFITALGPGVYPLTFTGGVGTGATGNYSIDQYGTVVSNPVITAGGNYSVMPVVSFLYGNGVNASGRVLPTGLPQIPDTDARIKNAFVGGPGNGGLPEVIRRPGVALQATIGAGRAQGGIAVGSHVFTINNDVGLLT